MFTKYGNLSYVDKIIFKTVVNLWMWLGDGWGGGLSTNDKLVAF